MEKYVFLDMFPIRLCWELQIQMKEFAMDLLLSTYSSGSRSSDVPRQVFYGSIGQSILLNTMRELNLSSSAICVVLNIFSLFVICPACGSVLLPFKMFQIHFYDIKIFCKNDYLLLCQADI